MDYPISDESARLLNGKFTDGDPVTGVPASRDSADYQNMVFDEIINAIRAGGEEPDEASVNQLADVIGVLMSKTANLLYMPIYPNIQTTNNKLTLIDNSGSITINSSQEWLMRGVDLYSTDDYTLADRTHNYAANKTYHLRWNKENGFQLKDLSDALYNPNLKNESDQSFDTSFDDMLVATIKTDDSNLADIMTYRNIPFYLPDMILQMESATSFLCNGYQTLLGSSFINDSARGCLGEIKWDLWFGSVSSLAYGEPEIIMNGEFINKGTRLHYGVSPGYSHTGNYIGCKSFFINRGSHDLFAMYSVENSNTFFNPGPLVDAGWQQSTSSLKINTLGGL